MRPGRVSASRPPKGNNVSREYRKAVRQAAKAVRQAAKAARQAAKAGRRDETTDGDELDSFLKAQCLELEGVDDPRSRCQGGVISFGVDPDGRVTVTQRLLHLRTARDPHDMTDAAAVVARAKGAR